MNDAELKNAFKSRTGHEPLSWQTRLFYEHFVKGNGLLPSVIDLPTGLGKTMVMAIWLIAREVNDALPRRLIYVVDRRTVVDQATDVAIMLQKSVGKDQVAVSTLRGQLADNREWSRDPSRPAIIIGTVDLIGSALLFSGYRSGYKTRPLHAGLLGQDSLLVLDEAHLSKPFEKLVTSITQFQHKQGSPMQVIRMSATSGDSKADKVFRLDTDPNSRTYDLKSDPDPNTGKERNQIITRFNAEKRLTVTTTDTVIDSIATASGKIAQSHPGTRVVIFVKTPKEVGDIRKALVKNDKYREAKIAMLTGTMRGLERDELVTAPDTDDQHERRVMQRFLNPDNDPSQGDCFLISTSAGEVGFDLNADHMVCDLTTLDSLIQRLGRVNRRGGEHRSAQIVMLADVPTAKLKDGKPQPLPPFDAALKLTYDLLSTEANGGEIDVSPKALAEFKSKLSPDQLKAASTPVPTMVDLTDILLDSWSMTSITERMPGRPEVAPWLRGIADELPQTTIAWRAELDLFKDDPNPQKPLKAIFAKHRIRTHESLTTNSYRVVAFLKEIKKKRPELLDTRVVLKFSRDLFVMTIGKLIDDDGILNADPTLILPATFGGLDKGMLSHEAIPPAPKPDDPPPKSLDVADEPGYEPRENALARLRILIERTDDRWKAVSLPGGVAIPADLNLEPSYATSTLLFKAFAKTDLRVRLVQPVAFDEEGDPVRSLVMLSPLADKAKKEDQLLTEHVGAVETEAQRIADELGLKDPIRAALRFGARWHDEGKKAAIWQNYVYGTDPDNPKGKSATTRDPKSLRGYRHEFGSLLRIHHPEQHTTDCTLPTDHETRELALHLIATHHGFGRPHFDNPMDRDFKTTQCDTIHTESIRRFARLQRKYGWWLIAWLENLLRCADALASAEQDAEDDEAGESNNAAGDAK
jgi:CRISPR-associated endonuclease/helicase Cas3